MTKQEIYVKICNDMFGLPDIDLEAKLRAIYELNKLYYADALDDCMSVLADKVGDIKFMWFRDSSHRVSVSIKPNGKIRWHYCFGEESRRKLVNHIEETEDSIKSIILLKAVI